jgi:5,10-methylenetetrahydromethanopterin reductase
VRRSRRTPENERHLVIHEVHLIKANPRDEPHVAELMAFASPMGLTGTVEQVSEKIAVGASCSVCPATTRKSGGY